MGELKLDRDLLKAAAGTAALAGIGGSMAPLAGLPAGAAAALCGLPMAVAACVADRRKGIAACVGFALAGTIALWRDWGTPSAISASIFVFASCGATLALGMARRRRHEKTVVGLERLNHQVFADVSRRHDSHSETSPPGGSVVDFGSAIASIDEAGRRITEYLGPDASVPAVIRAARQALKCRDATVYLWDRQTESLTEALPTRSRDAGRHVPAPSSGPAAWVIATRKVYTAAAAGTNRKLAVATDDGSRRPAGIAPLIAGGELIGLLVVENPERSLPAFDRLLSVVASYAALSLKSAELARRLENAAHRDTLTGLLTRDGLEAAADGPLDAARNGNPLTVLIAELDNIATINSECGEKAGDAVVTEAGRLWRAALPDGSVAARLCGAKFAALVPGWDLERSRELADGIREAVATHPFVYDVESLSITAGIGVAEYGSGGKSLDELLRRAEETLGQTAEVAAG